MVGHGSYRRKAKGVAGAWLIRIRRWRCQACKRTTGCLPDFLLSFRHYLVSVIQTVLTRRLEVEVSWSELVVHCTPEGLPALRTMQRWVDAFVQRAAIWLPAVGEVLAGQDSHSPWLDPRPPTEVAGQSAGTLLLTATLYLLAWGKTRWPELAGYGLTDRLAFLWHWGHDRGLGRLV
jgi:hypothetical protein